MEKKKNNQRIIDKINKVYSKDKQNNNSNTVEKNDRGDTIEIENLENNQNTENIDANIDISLENVIELVQKIDELSKANTELEDMLKRKVAEFENFKRRTDKEKMELFEYGNIKLLTRFIDLLDDLKNAQQTTQNTEDVVAVRKGVDMIKQKAEKLFENEGVKQMEVNIGDPFDVDKHEAMMLQESDLPEESVAMVIQNGYMYKDKVLRYAKVATAIGKKES